MQNLVSMDTILCNILMIISIFGKWWLCLFCLLCVDVNDQLECHHLNSKSCLPIFHAFMASLQTSSNLYTHLHTQINFFAFLIMDWHKTTWTFFNKTLSICTHLWIEDTCNQLEASYVHGYAKVWFLVRIVGLIMQECIKLQFALTQIHKTNMETMKQKQLNIY